jgi:hypothetical protein
LTRSAPGITIEGVGAGGEISAGAEPAPSARDDDGPDVVVLVGGIKGGDQFLLHGGVEGVELVGSVQRDGEDLFGDFVFDRFIRHRMFPSGLLNSSFRDTRLRVDPESQSMKWTRFRVRRFVTPRNDD